MSLPLHLSHSQRSSYLRCPNQFRLERAKFPQVPSVNLIAGGAFHSATDEVDRRLWAGVVPDDDECRQHFADYFTKECASALEREPDQSKWRTAGRRTKEKPNKEDVAWWSDAGAQMVVDYLKWRVAEKERGLDIWELPDGSPAIELAYEIEVGGSGPIRGAIDRVMATDTALILRDEKTSQRVPKDSSQLGQYRVAFLQMFGEEIDFGEYYMARYGETAPPVSLAHWTPELVEREYAPIAKARELGLYPANPGDACDAFGGCQVIEACAVKGGVLSDQWLTVMP